MQDIKITKDDIEEYILYSRMLYDEIQRQFTKAEVKDGDENIDDKITDSIVKTMYYQVIEEVYHNLLENFYTWLSHDCVFTGHKAKFHYEEPVFLKKGD